MSRRLAKRWITTDEYERMGAAGIFGTDARLELIEGSIYEMSPIGSRHAACVDTLTFILVGLAQRNFIVRIQSPIRLSDFSEPQPDVTLLRWQADRYRTAHPRPADVLLIIEVTGTTIETDRTVKLPLYAQAGINEVWLINLPDERIELYAAPVGGVYQTVQHFARGEDVQAQTLPGLVVSIADVFG